MIRRLALAFIFVAALLAPGVAPAQVQGGGMQQNEPQQAPQLQAKEPRTRAKIHTELGALYFQDRNIAVAMEELTVAIFIDQTYAPAYGMRALVHHYLKENNYAEDNFQQALRYGPDDPEIANNYGWFLCQVGKGKEAMPHFERALRNRLYQTPERAYLNAGQCALLLGDLRAAEAYLDKALSFGGGTPAARFWMAELQYRNGRPEEALKAVDELLRSMEPNAELLWLATRVQRKLGDREAEMRHATQLRRKFPNSPEYQELLKGNYE